MKKRIIFICIIISIFSINSLFAGFQFHINPKLGVDMGIANYNNYNTISFNYKANLNLQLGYGFEIDNNDTLEKFSLLLDLGVDNNSFTTMTKEDAEKSALAKFISSSSFLGVYTGLGLNFEFDDDTFFGLASGAKFGVGGNKLSLNKPIISPYVRLTLGEEFLQKDDMAMSVMFDIEYQYNIFDKNDYNKLFAVENVKNYNDLSLTLGLGIKFGK